MGVKIRCLYTGVGHWSSEDPGSKSENQWSSVREHSSGFDGESKSSILEHLQVGELVTAI